MSDQGKQQKTITYNDGNNEEEEEDEQPHQQQKNLFLSKQQEALAVKRIFACLSNPSGGCRLRSATDDVVAIVKLGSRLWGTFRPSSDFDCLVIHDNNDSNKSVRHVGATIARGVDVRMESVESFVEQMLCGSVRCWLAFLLMITEEQALLMTKTKAKASEEEDGDEHDTDRETGGSAEPSSCYLYRSSCAIPAFIEKVISSVRFLDKKSLIKKLFETLKEDEDRVMKALLNDQADDERKPDAATSSSTSSLATDKAFKIMKHSLRLVFSVSLIYDAMITTPVKSSQDNTATKSKAAWSKKKINSSSVTAARFHPSVDLDKDVHGIEGKVQQVMAHLTTTVSDDEEWNALTIEHVNEFYSQKVIRQYLPTDLVSEGDC